MGGAATLIPPGWPIAGCQKPDAPVSFGLRFPTVRQEHDYDWLVDRLGLRRQRRRAAAAPRRATASACSSAAAASPTTSCRARPGTCAATSGRRGSGCEGSSGSRRSATSRSCPAPASAAARSATRTRSTARRGGSTATRSGPISPTGSSALAPHFDEAERMLGVTDVEADDPADQLLREYGARDRRRRDLRQDARRRVLRRARRDRAGPVLRRRRAGPHRLHRCAGAAWSAARTTPRTRWSRTTCGSPSARGAEVHARARGRRRAAARRAGRLRGLRGDDRAPRRVAAPRPPHRARRAAWWSPPARSAPTSCSRAASCAGSLPRVSDRLGELVRTNSRGDPRGHAARRTTPDLIKRVAITSSVYPDPDTHIETVTYGDAGDSMSAALHADGRRRHARHAAAEAARHDRAPPAAGCAHAAGPRGWSRRTIIVLVMQTLDNAIALRAQARRCVGRRAAADRAGPGAPEPDVHPGRQPVRRLAGGAHGRDRAELGDGGGAEHPDAPRTSSAAP